MCDRKTDRILFIVALACAAALVIYLLFNMDRCQWDFKLYYYAAKALMAGGDPYNSTALSVLAGSPVVYRYCYPFFALFLFVPFAAVFEYRIAASLFLFFKLTLFVIVVVVWLRQFLEKKTEKGAFLLFVIFAFNSPVFEDLKTGNISMIEQMLIWLGLSMFLSGKYIRFAVFITASSCMKIFPIAFLAMLLFTRYPKRWGVAIGFSIVFLLIHGLAWRIQPEFYSGFLRNSSLLIHEDGLCNPSTFACIRYCFNRMGITGGVTTGLVPVLLTWGIVAVAVTAAGVQAMKRLIQHDTPENRIFLIALFCIMYSIIHPRFKDYSHILVLLPSWIIFMKSRTVLRGGWPLFILPLLPFNSNLPGIRGLTAYYSMFVLYLVFGSALYRIYRNTRTIGEIPDTKT